MSELDLLGEAETPTNAAARFAEGGMSVFPVDMRPGETCKGPLYGYRWKQRATSVVRDVVDDFIEAEQTIGIDYVGVGWALGLDGYVALDLDGVEPTWWGEIPETAVNETKRGRHLIYRQPPGRLVGNGDSRFPSSGWGEVRGAGGYIVVWWPGDRPGFDVAELWKVVAFPRPDWLTDAGDERPGVSTAALEAFKASHAFGNGAGVGGFVTKLNARPAGSSRNKCATDVACWIAREAAAGLVPATEAFDALEQWWASVSGPELDEKGALKTRKLTQREIRRIECWAIGQLTPERVEEMRVKAAAPVEDEDAGEDDDGFHAVDLGPYLRGTVVRVTPDLAVMSDGRALLHRARLNGVHGDSGTGKSWLVEFVVRELITAGLVVMVIDLEDTPDPLIERLRQIGVSDDVIERQVVFVRPHGSFTELNVERLIELVRERNVAHVLLETLGEALNVEGLNEDRDFEVGPWIRRVCRHLIEATTAGMTLIDHGTKSAERPYDPSGSKRKKAASTGTWWLMRTVVAFTREKGGRVEIVCAKDRHGWYRKGEIVAQLVMDPLDVITGGTTLRLEPAPATTAPDLVDQVEKVVGQAVVPISLRAVVAAVRKVSPASDASIRTAIDLAVSSGRIIESTGARKARLFSLPTVSGEGGSDTLGTQSGTQSDET
jgi:hypothetical protein